MKRVQMALVYFTAEKTGTGNYPGGLYQVTAFLDEQAMDDSFWTTKFNATFDGRGFPPIPYPEAPPLFINGQRYPYYETLGELQAHNHGGWFDVDKQKTVIKFPESDYFYLYRVAKFSSAGMVSAATDSIDGMPLEARYSGSHYDTTLIARATADNRKLDNILTQRMTFYPTTLSFINDGRYDEWITKALGAHVYYMLGDGKVNTLDDFKTIGYGRVDKVTFPTLDRVSLSLKDPRKVDTLKVNTNDFSLRESISISKDLLGKSKPMALSVGVDYKDRDLFNQPLIQAVKYNENSQKVWFVSDSWAGFYGDIHTVIIYWNNRDYAKYCTSTTPNKCDWWVYNKRKGLLYIDIENLGIPLNVELEVFTDMYGPYPKLDDNPKVTGGNVIDTALTLLNDTTGGEYSKISYDMETIDKLRESAPVTTTKYIDIQGEQLQAVVESLLASGNYRIFPKNGVLTISEITRKSARYYIREDIIDSTKTNIDSDSVFSIKTIRLNYDYDAATHTYRRAIHDTSLLTDESQGEDYEEDVDLQSTFETLNIAHVRYKTYQNAPIIISLQITEPLKVDLCDYVIYTLKRPYQNKTILPMAYWEVIGISKTNRTLTLRFSHYVSEELKQSFFGSLYGPKDLYIEDLYGNIQEAVRRNAI